MTMSPLSMLEPAERRAVIEAARTLGASTLDLFCTAHAFSRSSDDERARLLSSFCGIEALPADTLASSSAMREVESVAGWCSQNMPSCAAIDGAALRQALMCFQLNAHHTPHLGDRRCGAVYALGSRFAHSCLSANAAFEHDDENRLVHRATRAIEVGEVLSSNYLGPWEYGSTRARRAALERTKCFVCRCGTCAQMADPMRALPCPACGERRAADGLLPAADAHARAGASILESSCERCVVPFAPDAAACAEEWRCSGCGTASARAVDAAVSVDADWPLLPPPAGADQGVLGWERRIEAAAHNLLLHVYAARDGEVHPTLRRLGPIMAAVRRLLGRSHWALAFLLAMQLEATLGLVSSMEAEPEREVVRALESLLGLRVASLELLLDECARDASALHCWQRARAPHATIPLFEDVQELADLARRVASASARDPLAPALGATVRTRVLALVRHNLERVRVQHGEEARATLRLGESLAWLSALPADRDSAECE